MPKNVLLLFRLLTGDNPCPPPSLNPPASTSPAIAASSVRPSSVALEKAGYTNLLTATRDQLDLRDQAAVNYWFKANRPEYVFLVAGTVGGIWANATRPAEFIYDNMMIHATVVHAAYLYNVKKLLYLGSSCIYPRECPQPMREEYLLGNYLEPTNEPYAIAKIAGIKLCQAYRKQYGCNFISAMPTNLYGPNDNFDLDQLPRAPGPDPQISPGQTGRPGRLGSPPAGRSPLRSHPPIKDLLGIPIFATDHRPIQHRVFRSAYCHPTSPNAERHVVIWGTGSARREFLHVDDLADACLFIMENWEDPECISMSAQGRI